MHNKKIPESILKEIELINISLFKYINEEKNNEKGTELKMIYINNFINDILYKKEKAKNSLKNLSAKIRKRNYNLTSMENNKNNTNPDINDDCFDNSILKFKMKRKLKNEHDKFIIKELEYLQRISELQSQLKLYQKTIEQLIIENNQINNGINLNIISNNIKMNKVNSVSDLSLKENNNVKYIDIKNKRKSNKINNFHPSSNDYINKSMRSLKRNNYIMYQKNNTKNNIDSYSQVNLNKKNNQGRKYTAHLVNLNYKYEVGNAYYRNKFFKLKKDINEERMHLKKIKDLLNDIK